MPLQIAQAGQVIPEFRYDTPYQTQKSFYTLVGDGQPLFLVFLDALGQPVTEQVLFDYKNSFSRLNGLRLACVVRTPPAQAASRLPRTALPFELICDPEGELYRHFAVPQSRNRLRCCSLRALHLLRQAEKQGWQPTQPFQLPLTLLVGQGGAIQLAHYGKSLTDLPADCAAMQEVYRQLGRRQPPPAPDTLPAQPGQPNAEELRAWGVNEETLEFDAENPGK